MFGLTSIYLELWVASLKYFSSYFYKGYGGRKVITLPTAWSKYIILGRKLNSMIFILAYQSLMLVETFLMDGLEEEKKSH